MVGVIITNTIPFRSLLAAPSDKVMQSRLNVPIERGARQILNGRRFGVLFLRSRWFHMPKRITVAGRRVELSYPPNDPGVHVDFMVCIIRDEYGLGKLRSLRRIVDIGANIGLFSLAARNLHPAAEIHAYEPNPRTLPYLQQNVESVDIRVFGEAVGRTEGRVSMHDTGDSNLATVRTSAEGTISLTSFAKVMDRIGGEVDLLKLDCEGAEWELLEDAASWAGVRELRMEYHLVNGHTFDELNRSLRALGFRITHHAADRGFGNVWASRTERVGSSSGGTVRPA